MALLLYIQDLGVTAENVPTGSAQLLYPLHVSSCHGCTCQLDSDFSRSTGPLYTGPVRELHQFIAGHVQQETEKTV